GLPVMLAEAGEELGGRVTLESRLPGLSEWARVRDWRTHQLSKLPNVQIFPASRMAAEDVIDTGARHVLCATGSLWRADGRGRSFPGGVASFADLRTLTPDQVMCGRRGAGPVVIFDDEGYHMAGSLAELLADEGADVTYVTGAGVVSDWMGYTVEQHRIQARLIERGVKIMTSTLVSGLGAGVAHLDCAYSGRRSEIACGSLIPVTSREPQDQLWGSLQGRGLATLERLGDARAPGMIAHAVYDGHRAGRSLLATPEALLVKRERVIIGR
ncbi:MAG: hypothetical protein ORN49_08240, partial [Rhodobacteraceae bacterium]|nr:hypothetical protein [Paracoccaceae bacterium]